METVQALVEKLNEQLAQKVDKASLRHTAMQLLSALEEGTSISNQGQSISVIMPFTQESTEVPNVTEAILGKNVEVIEKISLDPIKDLRLAIGINDKFLFIETLFGGDEKKFEESIKNINQFHIYQEAQFWIKQQLRQAYQWEEDNPTVMAFDQLVKRRFS
jgi:hypothetical protein